MTDDDILALFGHSAGSVETTMFGETRVTISCAHAGCGLSGSIASTNPETARSLAALVVTEHYSQTESKP